MKLKHYDHDGRARFVTFAIHRHLTILTSDPLRQVVLDHIDQTRWEYKLRLLGYVIMLDHVHLVVVPPEDAELGRLIGDLKRKSSRDILDFLRANDSELLEELMVVRDGRLKSVLWQRRCFDHNCRNDDAVRSRIEYCHNNPVRRGLVKGAEDWPWSSCRWYLGMKDAKLPMDEFGM